LWDGDWQSNFTKKLKHKMENQELEQEQDKMWKDIEKSHRRGKIAGGLIIVLAGVLFLAKELGMMMPEWLFTWKMLVMAIGVIIAIKHKFLHPGWIILVGIGGAFLLNDIYPEMQIKPVLLPVLIIAVGLFVIFKPRRSYSYKMRNHWRKWHKYHDAHHKWEHEWERHSYNNKEEPSKEDMIESISLFASVKKNVVSKNFKGGEVVNIFGGSEINLSQGDFEGNINLEITQVFGGTRLIVPSNWEIKSDLVTVFGSVEDKRPVQPVVSTEPKKILMLTGVTFFGGIDIRSF
jgi:predicted membrane protein